MCSNPELSSSRISEQTALVCWVSNGFNETKTGLKYLLIQRQPGRQVPKDTHIHIHYYLLHIYLCCLYQNAAELGVGCCITGSPSCRRHVASGPGGGPCIVRALSYCNAPPPNQKETVMFPYKWGGYSRCATVADPGEDPCATHALSCQPNRERQLCCPHIITSPLHNHWFRGKQQ